MTLTEALAVLHRAGRIVTPWLPGMLITDHTGYSARLAWQDETRWNASYTSTEGVRGGWLRFLDGDLYRKRNGWRIVTSDPCTVGGLLALLREATRDEDVTVSHPSHNIADDQWNVWSGGGAGVLGRGPTEGEAIEAALIALARATG